MRGRSSPPGRLIDLRCEGESANLADLIRSAIDAPAEDMPLVKWRIRGTLRRQVEWRRRALRVALVGGLVFFTGGVVGAVVEPMLVARTRMVLSPGSGAAVAKASKHERSKRQRTTSLPDERVPVAPEEPAAEAIPPSPSPVADSIPAVVPPKSPESIHVVAMKKPPAAKTVAPPRQLASVDLYPTQSQNYRPARETLAGPGRAIETPMLAPAPISAPAPYAQPALAPPAMPPPAPPAPPPAAVSLDEQFFITSALRQLRNAHDPKAALSTLDAYGARFRSGVLAPEAARLRTEALLLLGRKDAVLAELEKPSSLDTPSSQERLVLRGELRAAAGRWRHAIEDFDLVLQAYLPSQRADVPRDVRSGERLERALWGRASARSHLSDDVGARADLLDYLRRFPSGRFAASAKRLLGQQP